MLEPLSSRERLQREPLTLALCIPFAEGKKVSNPGTDFGSLLRVKTEKDTSFHKNESFPVFQALYSIILLRLHPDPTHNFVW